MSKSKNKQLLLRAIDNFHRKCDQPDWSLEEEELYNFMADDSNPFEGFTKLEIELVKQRLLVGIMVIHEQVEKEDKEKSTLKVI